MVNYKEFQPSKVKETPFTDIGVDDLCSIETSFKGVLRKEGRLERIIKRIPWRRYYVVLSQGCVYVYPNEHSSSPKVSFSLLNYHKLQRNFTIPHSIEILPCTSDNKVYRFICECDTDRLDWMRALYVSLLSVHGETVPGEEGTKTRASLVKEHKRSKQGASRSNTSKNKLVNLKKSDEYLIVETTVKGQGGETKGIYEVGDDDDPSKDNDVGVEYDEPDNEGPVKRNKYSPDPTSVKGTRLPSLPGNFSEEPSTSKDRGSERTTKTKSLHHKKKTKPEIKPKPKSTKASKVSESPSLTSPKPNPEGKTDDGSYMNDLNPPKPGAGKTDAAYLNMGDGSGYVNPDGSGYVNPDPQDDPDEDYMFTGTKDEASSELNLTEKGTFLLRESSEAGKKVLVIQCGDKLMSFKVVYPENKIGLSNTDTFNTYKEMVEYYKKHDLPGKDFKLIKGFNEKEQKPSKKEAPKDGDYEPVATPNVKPKKSKKKT